MRFDTKEYGCWIGGIHYEVHKLFVADNISKKITDLKKYFHILCKDTVPIKFRRRKFDAEFVETAVMILGRIDSLIEQDIPIAAGSRYLFDKPWAVFGESSLECYINFRNFEDIVVHYSDELSLTKKAENFHFRLAPYLMFELSKKHKVSPHTVVSISICLLHDILHYCGPDCAELFDLFTNDLRVGAGNVDIDEWNNLRCKMMGRYGRIKEEFKKCKVGQIYKPYVKTISKINFDLLSESDDLEDGEKIIILPDKIPEETELDDGSIPPEQDVKFSGQVAKYPHLFGSGFRPCCE